MSTLKRALSKLFEPLFPRVRIERALDVADHFRRFDLKGESFVGARCAAGDKLQVTLDGDVRTFSPFAFDASAGRLSLLAFEHGDGPGARWVRSARPGDEIRVFGPRGSLPFDALKAPVLLVGDETSLGVAKALEGVHPASKILLEANDVASVRSAASALDLRDVQVVARAPRDTHWAGLWAAVKGASDEHTTLVLTGKAQTIQAVREFARRDGVRYAAQTNKAYWAPGKRGLD